VQKIIYTNKSPGEVEAGLRFGKSLFGKRLQRFADVFILRNTMQIDPRRNGADTPRDIKRVPPGNLRIKSYVP
jgi:hypothetical protein